MSGQYKVVKTNKFGKDQDRVLSLDFASGAIVNKNAKGKVMKTHVLYVAHWSQSA